MLSYQKNAYTKELQTDVIACTKCKGGYAVELLDTVFYPEGGGQPSDRGWIGDSVVFDVQKVNGQVIHKVNKPVNGLKINTRIDWERRFDLMQQHSGQHLLTAAALSTFGFRTVGIHLGETISSIELDTPEVTLEQKNALENTVNDMIRKALPIVSHLVTPEEYHSMNARSRRLPAGFDAQNELIRLIEIKGLDINTCGGTHVQNTCELQMCKLLHFEKIRQRVRIYFLFGGRITKHLDVMKQTESQLNKIFGQRPAAHVEVATKWSAELKNQRNSLKKLRDKYISLVASQLASSDQKVVLFHYEVEDMSFLTHLVNRLALQSPDKMFVLGAGERKGVFLIHAPSIAPNLIRTEVLPILDGRGGGKPPRIQGKCSRLDRLAEAASFLRAHCNQ